MNISNMGVTVATLLLVAGLSSACLITNCPRGGKRGGTSQNQQCTPCGPEGKGLCHGPSICCGPGMGCHVATPETAACRDAGPCLHSATMPCTDGVCSAPGVCCSHEFCRLDTSCLSPNNVADLFSRLDLEGYALTETK